MQLNFLVEVLPPGVFAEIKDKAKKAAPGAYNDLYEELVIDAATKYIRELQQACSKTVFSGNTAHIEKLLDDLMY